MTVNLQNFKGEDYLTRYLDLIEFTETWVISKPRLYVQGFEEWFDGYELDCLYLKIGVIAKSKVAGYGLLNLLWCLKDQSVDLSVHHLDIASDIRKSRRALNDMMIDGSNEDKFTLTDLLKEIVSDESSCGSVFDLGGPIKSEIRLRNETTGRMESSEVRNELHKIRSLYISSDWRRSLGSYELHGVRWILRPPLVKVDNRTKHMNL